MTIVIPGDYGGIGESVGQIANAVAKMLNPNHDFQVGMRDAMAKNPKLYQQLVDIEHTSPGTLEAMGFGKDLAKIANKGQSSHESIIENNLARSDELQNPSKETVTSAVQKLYTDQTTGQAAADKTKELQAEAAQKILNPKLSDGSDNPLYDPNVAEEAGYHYATGMSKVEAQQSILTAKAMKDAVNTDLNGRDMGKDMKAFVDAMESGGKGLDTKLINAYENTPGINTAWRQMLALEMQKRSLEMQYRKQQGLYDRADDRENEKTANRLVVQSHGAYTKDIAMKMISGDDTTVRRIGELASGSPMKAGEEDLYRAAMYDKAGQDQNYGSARKDIMMEINTSMGDLRKATGDSKMVPALLVNDALKRMGALNNDPKPLSVEWKGGKLHYMQDGKELNEPGFWSKVGAMFAGQRTSVGNAPPDAGLVNHAYHDVMSAKDRTKALSDLKAVDENTYNAVVEMMKPKK